MWGSRRHLLWQWGAAFGQPQPLLAVTVVRQFGVGSITDLLEYSATALRRA